MDRAGTEEAGVGSGEKLNTPEFWVDEYGHVIWKGRQVGLAAIIADSPGDYERLLATSNFKAVDMEQRGKPLIGLDRKIFGGL